MHLAQSAVVFYVIVAAYLAARRVEPRRIGLILAAGLGVGLLLSASLGVVYFLIVLVKPVETLSVFSMIGVSLAAAYFARDEILGTITPLGIILLNIAANFADRYSAVPMSFAPLLQWVPFATSPLGLPLRLLVLYAPSWIALWLLHRGPPGAPLLRYLLGAWVCFIGIVSVAGPGWAVMSGFRIDEPARWLASGFAVYAALHMLMLALNLFAGVAGGEEDRARSIARSVRVDATPPLRALLVGLAFFAACFIWTRLPLAGELKAGGLLAAALALAPLLARLPQGVPEPGDDGLAARGLPLGLTGRLVFFAVVVGALVLWLWPGLDPSPPRVPAAAPPKDIVLQYHEPRLQAALKQGLSGAAIPYKVDSHRGREFLRVAVEHREAVKKVTEAIEGPPLPQNRAMQFTKPGLQQSFSAWLERKGVKWEVVHKQLQPYFVVEGVPGHEMLYMAFSDSERDKRLGIDYHGVYVVTRRPGADLDPQRVAAFESAEHRARFEAWLRARGIEPTRAAHDGVDFVAWRDAAPDLLAQYVRAN